MTQFHGELKVYLFDTKLDSLVAGAGGSCLDQLLPHSLNCSSELDTFDRQPNLPSQRRPIVDAS
ncbi:hypothetical protein ACFWWB_12985 [Streptomyces sp. NPDC058690]|uniref:hypothetical protein n=1 Tax=Streptomyces sp. NPDC058690 TaxID=3346600 RepID=UPI0036579CBE